MSESQARTINALAAEIANLRDRLAAAERARDEIIGALRNYEANGSNAVKQIEGIYADLEDATRMMVRMRAALRDIEEQTTDHAACARARAVLGRGK